MGFRDQNNKVAPIDDGGNFDTDTNVNSVTSTSEAAANALLAANHAEDALAAKIAAELAETNAETAETNAETAETNASTSATNAATSETNASTSETNAAASASAAASSAADAQSSEDDAEVSETNAANSAAAALVSENNASTSETNAAASAVTAATQAGISTTKAGEASVSAAAALVSENNASTSETNAAASETNAATSESNAAASAVSAETAKTNAETAETNAATSETNAAASAVTATTQAGIATTKAGEASTSATNAEASKVAAAASQVAASNSQIAAATSASSAAAVFDQFDDTYLGSKASEPTVDNDGNALVVGALFYNSSTQGMFIWTGTEWVAASAAGGASLNNFSYTATAGQTTFTGSDENTNNLSYTVDNIIVTLNGVVLEGGGTDYTATDGSSIVLTSGAALSDEVNIVAFKTFTTADMVSSANGGAFQGNVDFNAGIDVTGNITVTGTVDGVDVAAFKASYDSLDLDGDYVNSTGDTMTGDLALSGADVTFGDSDKAIFGAGSDLQIYHDGSNSYINDAGTGSLLIQANGALDINKYTGENMARFFADGEVQLYFDSAIKLATQSGGVNITGTLTSDGVQSTDGDIKVTTLNSFVGFNSQRAGVPSSGGYQLGRLNFDAYSTGTTFVSGASIQSYSDGAAWTSSSTPAYLTFRTTPSGSTSLKERIKVASNGDISFYEDTGTTPKFFWDASAESLGIGAGDINLSGVGTGGFNTVVTVQGNNQFRGILELANSTGVSSVNGSAGDVSWFDNDNKIAQVSALGQDLTNHDDGDLAFYTASGGTLTERMRITSSGNVGIGTSSPATALTVSTDGTEQLTINRADASINTGNTVGTILFTGDDPSANQTGARIQILAAENWSTNAYGSHITFSNDSSGTLTERMRIDSSGNVGIGTSSPVSIGGYTITTLNNSGNGSALYLQQAAATKGRVITTANELVVDTTAAIPLVFGTNNAERMRIDSSGNVGIGTSPSTELHVASSSGYAELRLQGASGSSGSLEFYDSTTKRGDIYVDPSSNIVFRNISETMRIDSSGNLLVGTTTIVSPNPGHSFSAGNGAQHAIGHNGTTTGTYYSYYSYNGSVIGSITQSGTTSVAYNTSSDYRLKTDAQPMTGASARVQALKPVNFEWIASGERVDGFLAHEAQEIVPEAVTGEKDAMRDEEYEVTPAVLDDDGNVVTEAVMGTRSVPDYQGIDQSKLVPLLTAALQEALTKIDALETRITALEG